MQMMQDILDGTIQEQVLDQEVQVLERNTKLRAGILVDHKNGDVVHNITGV
jgi:hypothetical protein